EDSHGRTLWALGAVVSRTPSKKTLAGQLFRDALPAVRDFTSPRACAFALLGIGEYMRAFGGDREVEGLQRLLAAQLLARFASKLDSPWPWCEASLTYDNARLAQALIVSGR